MVADSEVETIVDAESDPVGVVVLPRLVESAPEDPTPVELCDSPSLAFVVPPEPGEQPMIVDSSKNSAERGYDCDHIMAP